MYEKQRVKKEGSRGRVSGVEEDKDVHIVPVRFRPRTITFIGRVRTDGSVSTRRGFDGAMVVVLVDLGMVDERFV